MHEYPATQRIIEIACAKAAEHGSPRVRSIDLVVGEDAGYIGESIRLYFGMIAAGTACADAELRIRHIRPQLRCTGCGALFERRPFSFQCPHCQATGRPSEIGREFYVEAVELERADGGTTATGGRTDV